MKSVRSIAVNSLIVLLTIGITVGVLFLLVPGLAARLGLTDGQWLVYRVRDGDLLYFQRHLTVFPTDADRILAEHVITWGDDGFRMPENPVPPQDYRIIAIGDSYTEGRAVAKPWPDLLAADLNEPVRNLGYSGLGPREYELVAQEMLLEAGLAPEVIIVGLFGANDVAFARQDAIALPNAAGGVPGELTAPPEISPSDATTAGQNPLFPMTITPNGEPYTVAFLLDYIWWMNVSPGGLDSTRNLQGIYDTMWYLNDRFPDTCSILVYFPSKPEIYLRYLSLVDRDRLEAHGGFRKVARQDDGLAVTVPDEDSSLEDIITRSGVMADEVERPVLRAPSNYFDLTLAFVDAAERGELLYYPYDTHWNQRGHEIAAAAISEYLVSGVCPRQ